MSMENIASPIPFKTMNYSNTWLLPFKTRMDGSFCLSLGTPTTVWFWIVCGLRRKPQITAPNTYQDELDYVIFKSVFFLYIK